MRFSLIRLTIIIFIFVIMSTCAAINCQPCKIQEARKIHAEEMQRKANQNRNTTVAA
ncbi:uncharacterized protein LOC118740487 [Rhagoletis pomonella]|uniref:uncharacterized protein LOC118740487 n=1 Tax=Rhagoletis pomonella TaxID=28610 RepID=UPI00177E9F37|nr:uncharacterized protein LOC118740487 [Rhagoletis pomonella]